ncbi:hypothetical protein [Nocardia rhizosphaerae]|uniref:DUF4351 domain-containing protein n=1 Tax=Nocardia rhizosphaerae TaxID=1691571 RepID=A0ABV8L653_9NOCA
MTTAERISAEAEARGEARGRAEPLIEQLIMKFGAVPAAVAARIRAGSMDQLREWIRRVLTVDTIDEVFA